MAIKNIIESNISKQHVLPFSVDEASFLIWLNQLELKDTVGALEIISSALLSLKHANIPTEMKYLFLKKLSPLVFQYSEQLEKTYIKSYFPFSSESLSKVKLSAYCAMETAENYALICKDESFHTNGTFSSQQKSLILVNAIQAMTKVLLYCSTLYQPAQKGFWGLCFLFYLLARKHSLLDISCNQNGTCFITVFKQLIVFYLSNTQQFNIEEIHFIFKWLEPLAGQVELLSKPPKNKISKIPCINLKIDEPPKILNKPDFEVSAYLFYISNHQLVKKLIEFSGHKKNMSYNYKILALRLIKTLTMTQHRANIRNNVNKQLHAELGFGQLMIFLLQKESDLNSKGVILSKTQKLSIEDIDDISTGSREKSNRNELEANLSLLVQPDISMADNILSVDIWATKNVRPEPEPEEVAPVINATLLDQSKSGFCIGINGKNAETKIGDIIHLFTPTSSTVCVVRRFVPNHHYDVVAGVEILGYNPKILHVMDIENKQEHNACVLTNSQGKTTIVIKANEFQNTDFLYADSSDKILRYKVEKILDSSTSMTRHLKVDLS